MLIVRGSAGPMTRQQLQALLAVAEQQPELRRCLRLQDDSWELWLKQVQALGFAVTAADLQQAQLEERMRCFFRSSQLPSIRSLR